ncbi:MAG TPA: hypothetical protein VHP58_03385 [Alphaproteobacteria bacterium]|nr:hypothetical protein [Alphaproteobacteria bacterium]
MPKKTHTGYRSSKTGEFVTKKYAESHKATTQKEAVPNPGFGDTDRSSKSENKTPQKGRTDQKK